jgi:hypothetical protein
MGCKFVKYATKEKSKRKEVVWDMRRCNDFDKQAA